MHPTPHGVQRGFTIVELLVVIGIIALLVTILLPTLSRAREVADTVKCLSNLRQLALANSMYVAQSKGWAVPGVMGSRPDNRAMWQNNNGWRRNIDLPAVEPGGPSEIGVSEAPDGLICPAALMARDRGRINHSYGYNIRHVNYLPKPLIITLPVASDWNSTTEFAGVKATRVRNPADKIQFMDAMTPFVEPQTSNHYARIDQFQEYGQPPGANPTARLPAYRHSRDPKRDAARINIAFWDGHAATMRRGEVAAVTTPHEPPDVDGPPANRTPAWNRHWELGIN